MHLRYLKDITKIPILCCQQVTLHLSHLRNIFLRIMEQMPIDIKGHVDGRMTEQNLDLLGCPTLFNEQRSCDMTQ